jgi:hypothetical protein
VGEAYRIVVAKPARTRLLGGTITRWDGNITVDLK